MNETSTVIDASNLILGRLASITAKRLLKGEKIVIVNAEKTVKSGRRDNIVDEAKARLHTRTLGAKSKSPKHPRKPDGIVRRTIRGMLPMDKSKGRAAYKRLKVYFGVPDGLDDSQIQTLPEAKITNIKTSLTTIGAIAENIGWSTSR